jgi:hypothetical protein
MRSPGGHERHLLHGAHPTQLRTLRLALFRRAVEETLCCLLALASGGLALGGRGAGVEDGVVSANVSAAPSVTAENPANKAPTNSRNARGPWESAGVPATCAKCRRGFSDSETVYLRYWCYVQRLCTMCEPCAISSLGTRHTAPEPCECCGRVVCFKAPGDFRCARRRVFCCNFCRSRHRNQQAKAARALRLQSCERCDRTYNAARSDAKFCSPACRQAAYRRRCAVLEARA